MGEWQPIETAPKDETPILAFERRAMGDAWVVLEWVEDGTSIDLDVMGESAAGWTEPHDGYVDFWEPTHWMPLPNPPEDNHG